MTDFLSWRIDWDNVICGACGGAWVVTVIYAAAIL